MIRSSLVFTVVLAAAAGVTAQQPGSSSQYEGTSTPPPDDTIVTTVTVESTPTPSQRVHVETTVPEQQANDRARAESRQAAPVYEDREQPPMRQAEYDGPRVVPQVVQGSDDGIVGNGDPNWRPTYTTRTVSRTETPELRARSYPYDPDGDIVHPAAPRPGEIAAGTTIRVRLLTRLSSGFNERGEQFRTRVASDVVRGDRVLIPAGAEIEGRIVEVSRGHVGGSGTLRLRPETVIMPNGLRYRIDAEVTGTPGSRTTVKSEGTIKAGSRAERDGIEYGAAMGAGAVTGGLLAGPGGALTGTIVGAGAVTVHLMTNHPQATLEKGTAIMLTLTEPLYMSRSPERYSEN